MMLYYVSMNLLDPPPFLPLLIPSSLLPFSSPPHSSLPNSFFIHYS